MSNIGGKIGNARFFVSGQRKTKKRGFTITELLVVIAIISILAALLLPTLRKARDSAKHICCMNIQKQLTLCCINYADDNNRDLPRDYSDSPVNPSGCYYWTWRDYLIANGYLEIPFKRQVMLAKYIRINYSGSAAHKSFDCPSASYKEPKDLPLIFIGRAQDYDEKYGKQRHPSKIIMLGDTKKTYVSHQEYYFCYRHFGGHNYSFYDGHVEFWNRAKIDKYADPYTKSHLPWYDASRYANGDKEIN